MDWMLDERGRGVEELGEGAEEARFADCCWVRHEGLIAHLLLLSFRVCTGMNDCCYHLPFPYLWEFYM